MAHELLLDLIKSLDNSEQKTAKTWMASPLHNQKERLSLLFSELAEKYHELDIEPDVDAIIIHYYPETAKDKSKRLKIGHELLAKLEELLVYLNTQKNSWAYRQAILKDYRNRGLHTHLQRRINQFRKKGKEELSAAEDRFYLDYQLEKEQYFLLATKKRNDKHNLLEQENAMLRAFLATRFRQACETLAHLRIFRRDFPPLLLEQSICFYASHPTPELPGIHLFYLATLLYLKRESDADTDQIFNELKDGIETHIHDFPKQDQRNLIVLAINHCVRESNAGRPEYLNQTLELYKLGLSRKLFYESGRIGIFTFNNILGIALRLDETDWAEAFLEKNVRRLPLEKREEVESLSRARLSFKRGDYDQTISHLQTADYQDFIHHLTARVMQLKIYFERDSYNLLTSHIRATKSLIKRRKNLGYHQRNYLNIFSLAEKILRLPPGNSPQRNALRQQIEDTDPCTEKEWLLLAVDEAF